MARNKVEPITGLPDEEKLLVQKSLPLFALWQSDLTLAEFKILDTYLSRIDSHKPERRVVIFEKGELENLLGVQKINKKDLEVRLKHLMGSVVKLEDNDSKKGFRLVTLFEEAVAEQDENGIWQVKLECTQKAMKYFFNVENLGYLRYKLRSITSLTSRYTYIMFTYLEHNRFRKSWEVGVDELKAILHCDDEETYKEFKRFNDRLLKRVQKEMHEKTECRYSYAPVRKGRTVTAIRFELESLSLLEQADRDPDQITFDDIQPPAIEDETLEFYAGALTPKGGECEFNAEELELIRQKLIAVAADELPMPGENIDIRRYHYLAGKFTLLNIYHAKKPIKNRCAYLCKMLEKEQKTA